MTGRLRPGEYFRAITGRAIKFGRPRFGAVVWLRRAEWRGESIWARLRRWWVAQSLQ